MRYAFVSDIHANLQAWKAVFNDILANNVDRIISLGDVVGYGPNPHEIIRDINTKVDAYVLGNHDAAVIGKLDSTLFNEEARQVLDWTRKQLKEEDRKFLGTFPLTLVGDGFRCAHGEFTHPANFDYILDPEAALASWKAVPDNLLIVGHTHEPALYVLGNSGTPRLVEPQDFVMEAGKRYLVNIGSIGQPRGSDLRSCYCIYDSEKKSLYWRRVGFDLDAYRKSLKATGLTLDPSYYLKPEPRRVSETPPPRPTVFTPPQSPEKAAHDVVMEKDIKILPRRPQKMPLNMKIILAAIAIIIGVQIWRTVPHAAEIKGVAGNALRASSGNVIRLPASAILPGKEIPGWNVRLADKKRQGAGINLNSMKVPFLYIQSKKPKRTLELESSRYIAEPGQTWSLDAEAQIYGSYAGAVTVSLILTPSDGSAEKILLARKVGGDVFTGTSRIQGQATVPQGGTVHIRITGNFSGTLLFPAFSLTTSAGRRMPAVDAGEREATPVPRASGDDPWAMPPKN